jgi:hypothetical protein
MKRTWVLPTTVLAIAGVAALAVLTGPARPAAADGAEKPAYIGAEACKKCHFKQYKSWKDTAMASSLEKLKPNVAADKKKAGGLDPAADYSKDEKCLRCHTTGYGTDTGYPAVVAGKAWTPAEEERAKMLAGTSCEACHGPGSLYAPYKKAHDDFKIADITALGATSPPKAEQCMACHKKECPTMPADYAWSFEKGKASKDIHEHVPLKKPH